MRPVVAHGAGAKCPCCVGLRSALLNAQRQLVHTRAPPTSASTVPAQGLRARQPLSIQIAEDTLEQLKRAAAEENCSVDDLLVSAAENWLDERKILKKGNRRSPVDSLDAVYVLEPIITLVDGLLHGEHTVAQALTHGDTGLGTLDLLDGEVVVYQGVAYHQSADGIVRVLQGSETTPFMTLCHRDPQHQTMVTVDEDLDYAGLQKLLRTKVFRSSNVFYVMEIQGLFPTVAARVVRKQDHDRPLVEVAADQALFEFKQEEGVLVGFYSPEFMGSSINVPGFHLHYLSGDRQRGGHLLDCHVKAGATISVQEMHRIKVDIPYRDAFMGSNLARDIKKEIEAAERAKDA